MSIKRLCNYPGCKETVQYNERYCEKHKPKQEEKPYIHSETEYRYLYNTPEWKVMSSKHLKEFPTCIKCGGKATEVHHVIPHRGDTSLFYNKDNLVSLCHDCHSKETARERRDRLKQIAIQKNMIRRHHILTDNYQAR